MSTTRLRRTSLLKVVLVTVAALLAVCLLALVGMERTAEATFLGVNGKIAFASTRDGDSEIYVMNPDGTNPTQLTNNPAWEGDPTVSPDGKRVAFVTDRNGGLDHEDIYVVDTADTNKDGNGNNLRPLTEDTNSDYAPTFSPDGKRVAYQEYEDGDSEIYVMNSNGTGTPTRLTNNTLFDGVPVFSADGTKVYFNTDRDGDSGQRTELYVMDVADNDNDGNGDNLDELFGDPAIDYFSAAISPDEKKLAYQDYSDGDSEIYVKNLDGTGIPQRLTTNSKWDGFPAFSPDGKKLVFGTDRDLGVGKEEIYTMDVADNDADGNGDNQDRLTEDATSDYDPDWGPRPAGAVNTPPQYIVTDLGAISAVPDSEANAINTSGQVVGHLSNGSAPDPVAFLYENGVMNELGLLPGASGSEAHGINDKAKIVGSADVGGTKRAFLYENGTMTNLGTLPNPGESGGSEAYDINTSGQVVGYSATLEGSTDPQPDEHAFLYERGSMKDLGTLESDNPSRAKSINNLGQIVGYVDLPTGDSTAFLYENGAMTDLGARMGANLSRAQDINDSHQIVGAAKLSSDPEAYPHAFLHDADGTVTDLGTLPRHGLSVGFSEAYAVNGSGQVVGYSAMDSRGIDARAFLYHGGAMTDLNDLIPAESGLVLAGAWDINDRGMIVGLGYKLDTGGEHAFLLTPLYNFSGFYEPVDNLPTLNKTKPGKTIPVRFSLGADLGLDIFESGYPQSAPIECDSTAPVDDLESTVAGKGGLSYDPVSDRYTYAWDTSGMGKGCRQLVLKFKDGSTQRANFIFR